MLCSAGQLAKSSSGSKRLSAPHASVTTRARCVTAVVGGSQFAGHREIHWVVIIVGKQIQGTQLTYDPTFDLLERSSRDDVQMNVICFDIEVAFRPTLWERAVECFRYLFRVKSKPSLVPSPTIKAFICSRFKDGSDTPVDYEINAQTKWNGLPGEKMKALRSPQSIVGALRVAKIDCFVFHQDNFALKDRITLEVIILSEIKNIDHSVFATFKEIKRQLTRDCCVAALVESSVLLFPWNREGNDIWDADYRIRANFSSATLTASERNRAFVATSAMVLVLTILYFGTFSDTTVGRLSGIAISCAVVMLTDIVPRFIRGKVLTVRIDDLSTVVDDPPEVPYTDEGTPNLSNPPVPQ